MAQIILPDLKKAEVITLRVLRDAQEAIRLLDSVEGLTQEKKPFIACLEHVAGANLFAMEVAAGLPVGLQSLKPYLALSGLDSVLGDYLRVQTAWDAKLRMSWFAQKISETISFLCFCRARHQFLKELDDLNLSSVISRIKGQTVDVEAGVFSLRDVKIVMGSALQNEKIS